MGGKPALDKQSKQRRNKEKEPFGFDGVRPASTALDFTGGVQHMAVESKAKGKKKTEHFVPRMHKQHIPWTIDSGVRYLPLVAQREPR